MICGTSSAPLSRCPARARRPIALRLWPGIRGKKRHQARARRMPHQHGASSYRAPALRLLLDEGHRAVSACSTGFAFGTRRLLMDTNTPTVPHPAADSSFTTTCRLDLSPKARAPPWTIAMIGALAGLGSKGNNRRAAPDQNDSEHTMLSCAAAMAAMARAARTARAFVGRFMAQSLGEAGLKGAKKLVANCRLPCRLP